MATDTALIAVGDDGAVFEARIETSEEYNFTSIAYLLYQNDHDTWHQETHLYSVIDNTDINLEVLRGGKGQPYGRQFQKHGTLDENQLWDETIPFSFQNGWLNIESNKPVSGYTTIETSELQSTKRSNLPMLNGSTSDSRMIISHIPKDRENFTVSFVLHNPNNAINQVETRLYNDLGVDVTESFVDPGFREFSLLPMEMKHENCSSLFFPNEAPVSWVVFQSKEKLPLTGLILYNRNNSEFAVIPSPSDSQGQSEQIIPIYFPIDSNEDWQGFVILNTHSQAQDISLTLYDKVGQVIHHFVDLFDARQKKLGLLAHHDLKFPIGEDINLFEGISSDTLENVGCLLVKSTNSVSCFSLGGLMGQTMEGSPILNFGARLSLAVPPFEGDFNENNPEKRALALELIASNDDTIMILGENASGKVITEIIVELKALQIFEMELLHSESNSIWRFQTESKDQTLSVRLFDRRPPPAASLTITPASITRDPLENLIKSGTSGVKSKQTTEL